MTANATGTTRYVVETSVIDAAGNIYMLGAAQGDICNDVWRSADQGAAPHRLATHTAYQPCALRACACVRARARVCVRVRVRACVRVCVQVFAHVRKCGRVQISVGACVCA